ncbi:MULTISPECIES: RES family NAD+ phosphorylase [Crossiella]|uniref:RES family NAD+ phosphorylase n=1 Tax=Crossiella TaxID=130795 RepID=UPI0016208442|nr:MULTISPECIES: RES family NAD+ phosphorylase [Crossiella]MCK2239674.1 RES family NAD+ phosphorylase [Crossiella sp. S99.2]MCK2252369.1 RES family NAD+ phosphorylase [Crossiella sp. S99.1]MCO1579870.1 RES family NAD+ phosphorylase [Crossiella sp. SN42]WHT17366.1 RES family NAD+ phosphorylase [Crossiella sp. CA-258035]
MARLPPPPTPAALQALLRRTEDVVAVHRATRLVRIFAAGGTHPQRWNSFRYAGPLPHARFDPHPATLDGRPIETHEHGVLYFGLSVRTSVAEVYQATSTVDRRTRSPHLVVLRPRRTLRLLDLSGLWPTRAGASQSISTGPKDRTQAWARAIRAAYPELDGLWYRSSMDTGNPAICLWDPPGMSALPIAPDVLLPLDHPGLDLPLARICEELNYTLLG